MVRFVNNFFLWFFENCLNRVVCDSDGGCDLLDMVMEVVLFFIVFIRFVFFFMLLEVILSVIRKCFLNWRFNFM